MLNNEEVDQLKIWYEEIFKEPAESSQEFIKFVNKTNVHLLRIKIEELCWEYQIQNIYNNIPNSVRDLENFVMQIIEEEFPSEDDYYEEDYYDESDYDYEDEEEENEDDN